MRKTLFERLTPRAIQSLDEHRADGHGVSIDAIEESLKKAEYWGELTVDDVRRLVLFTDMRWELLGDGTYMQLVWGIEELISNEENLI